MSSLTFQMPDAQLQELQRIAHQRGLSVQSLVAEFVCMLAPVTRNEPSIGDVTQDALFKMEAAGASGLGNLADEHDHYLYGAPQRG